MEQYDIAFVSTGDVLRKEIMAKSDVGKKAEEVVARGGEFRVSEQIAKESLTIGLVSDELMLEIVKAELDRLKGRVGLLRPTSTTMLTVELDYRWFSENIASRRITRLGPSARSPHLAQVPSFGALRPESTFEHDSPPQRAR